MFIVIIGVYYYFIYSGLKSKEAQKQNTLNAAASKYNSYLTLARSYPLVLKQDKKLSKEFAGLLLELPSKKNMPQLLMKISNYEKVLIGSNVKGTVTMKMKNVPLKNILSLILSQHGLEYR